MIEFAAMLYMCIASFMAGIVCAASFDIRGEFTWRTSVVALVMGAFWPYYLACFFIDYVKKKS